MVELSEVVQDPVESLTCPQCGALIPIFKQVNEIKCVSCGAVMIRVSVEREYVLRVLGVRDK